MASTLKNDEEREERVLLVGEYVKETGASTRKTAEYFTKTYFPISNYTVSDYCKRHMKMKPSEVELLKDKIDLNTAKSINDEAIRERVIRNADLLLSSLSINEIVSLTNVSFWTIYRDLTKRLQIVDNTKYNLVKELLIDHSKENLNHAK